jgi:hypothetical protein
MFNCRNVTIVILLCALFFSVAAQADALAPESIVSKKYYYEVRCTCGLLFEVKETDCKENENMVSHTMCYDCFMKDNEYTDVLSFQTRVNLFVSTVLAKERQLKMSA